VIVRVSAKVREDRAEIALPSAERVKSDREQEHEHQACGRRMSVRR